MIMGKRCLFIELVNVSQGPQLRWVAPPSHLRPLPTPWSHRPPQSMASLNPGESAPSEPVFLHTPGLAGR